MSTVITEKGGRNVTGILRKDGVSKFTLVEICDSNKDKFGVIFLSRRWKILFVVMYIAPSVNLTIIG